MSCLHFELIFRDAFTGEAVAGGAIGAVIRYGVARGVFSNEAGMGSAPIAAAAAKTDHPARQGLVSMTGTFIDTIIVCSITGIVLVMGFIMAGNSFGGATGAVLTTQVFRPVIARLWWLGRYIRDYFLRLFHHSRLELLWRKMLYIFIRRKIRIDLPPDLYCFGVHWYHRDTRSRLVICRYL